MNVESKPASLPLQINDFFSPEGKLSQSLDGFTYRNEQQTLAKAVADAIHSKTTLVAEAGTGIGKTIAYLVPAILSREKVIISTGTKHLQDQIIHKDIPLLQKALTGPVSVAVLKGRANYLCLQRLNATAFSSDFFDNDSLSELQTIKEWGDQTKSGDIAEIPSIADHSNIWPLVTSTSDNCIGKDCDYYQKCHLVKARKKALDADVLIVNHHLFFSDIVVREEGFTQILPAFNHVIFDEAHQITETAAQFFGQKFTSRQLAYLLQESLSLTDEHARDNRDISITANKLAEWLAQIRYYLANIAGRGTWSEAYQQEKIRHCVHVILELLTDYKNILSDLIERHPDFDACYSRASKYLSLFNQLTGKSEAEHVHWFEVFAKSFVIHQTPINIAEQFQSIMATNQSWIFTSATLMVDQSSQHFEAALGIQQATTCLLYSPFDYQRQSLLYLPPNLPPPAADDFLRAIVAAALPIIQYANGRCFFLVTSYRALNACYEQLSAQSPYPVLCQGSMPKQELLQKFMELGNAVLVATNSFWEGVDVRGDALSCVIIEKLPFASPGDPVLKARTEWMRQKKQDPFRDYQLPKAVIQLRQGVGRLIRDIHDKGVLMICDNRIIHKSYAKSFWQSLPSIPVTRDKDDIKAFFEQMNENNDSELI